MAHGGFTLASRWPSWPPITNFDHEEKLNNDKRNIFVLKASYLNIIFDDLEGIMEYKKGSTQFVDETLVQGDNIRLYD